MKPKIRFIPILLIVSLLQISCMSLSGKDDTTSGSSYIPEHLISSFSTLCPTTSGNWTLISLGEARKIKTVLTTLRDDPQCQNVAYAMLDQVDSLQSALFRIEENSLKRRILGVQKEQITIMNMLKQIENGETLPLSQDSLERRFSENQLSLAVYRGQLGYDKREAQNAHVANTVVQTTASIFEQMSIAQECLVKSPQLFSGLAALSTSLASSIAEGGASLALAASHQLLGNLFEFYRKNELNEYVAKLNQGEFSSAYQCVLESLSNQWCDAMDMHDLIDFRINNKTEEINLFSQGIKIINRDLPILSSWLTKLTSPDNPVNSAHAFRQTSFLNRENMLKVWRTSALGILGDAEDKLPQQMSGEEQRRTQFAILQSAIFDMNPEQILPPTGIKNPLYEVINKKEFNWLILGLKPQNVPKTQSKDKEILDFFEMSPETFKDHPSLGIVYPLDPDKIRSSINRIYEQVAKILETQKSDTLNADSHSLLWDAEDTNYSGVGGVSGTSPLNAIDNILDYLKVYSVGGIPTDCSAPNAETFRHYENMDKIYAETQSILCGIKKQIKMKNKNYRFRLQKISSLANLDSGGVSFVRDRIERIIKLALRNYLKSHGHQINVQKKLLLVEDIITELSQYGPANLSQIKFDIQNALKNFEETTQNFAEIFSKSLEQTVRYVYKKNVDDPITNNLITKYCALLLSVPNWNSEELKDIDLSLCYGRGLVSEWDSTAGNFEFTYSEQLYRSDFSRSRMCHFKRFLRREEFLQSYRHDTPDFLIKRPNL